MPPDSAFLDVKSLELRLGAFTLKKLDLTCARGQYHILLGPSGCGKTTLLKCLLGFHRPRRGSIHLDGRNITGELPERRRMGYVPQDYALFPHLDVEDNLRFGLRALKTPATEADALINKLCDMLRIEPLRRRPVHNLSGGERQRVALGRALAIRPEIILLDEPFSAIDESGKRRLWFELNEIVREVGITTLHVTHNLDEAYTLGQRLSVLIDGNVMQSGSKQEIFDRPANVDVAGYLNYRNIFAGIAGDEPGGGSRVHTEHFDIVVGERLPAGRRVSLCVRAQDIKIVREGAPLKDSLVRNVFAGEISALFPLPEACLMWFRISGSKREFDFEVRFPRHIMLRHSLRTGKQVRVAFWEPTIIVFDPAEAQCGP